MPEAPARTPKKAPLKIWNDWSAGVGFAKDGVADGMYRASALLGLSGELRVAPFLNTCAMNLAFVYSAWTLNAAPTVAVSAAVAIAPASGATVAALGTDSTSSGGGANLTFAHTVPTYTNGALYVVVCTDGSVTPSACTFNGDSLTLVVSHVSVANRITIWRRVAPDVATGDVVVTCGATDIVAYAATFQGVHQTTPETSSGSRTMSAAAYPTGPSSIELTAVTNGMLIDAVSCDTAVGDCIPDIRTTQLLDTTRTNLRAAVGRRALATVPEVHFQYFFDVAADVDPRSRFLYAVFGHRTGGHVNAYKIYLDNANFGTDTGGGAYDFAFQLPMFPGQPAYYKGRWQLPKGNDQMQIALELVGTGNITTDTFDTAVTPFEPGADHLVAFGNQLAGIVKEGVTGIPGLGGVGSQAGGVRILGVDADPTDGAVWGTEFPAGDVTDRAGGLLNLHGATYVMMPDGLYSFNKIGRSGMVLSDLGEWVNFHRNILWDAWKGGLMIPHPSGLIFYVPGNEPEYVGIGGGLGAQALPPAGVTSIYGGYYHSVAPIGDYVYIVYQPDPSSTSAFLLCGYGGGNAGALTWQVLAPITLNDVSLEMGCHVVRSGRPRSVNYVTPTIWTQSADDLVYAVLDGSGGPFRERADTHEVAQSGSAVMSELFFEQPVDLDEIVTYCQDMGTSDEWQLSVIVNGTGREENIGRPFTGDGRDSRQMSSFKRVHRLTLIVTFTTTDTSVRVPPSLSRIELFGGVA